MGYWQVDGGLCKRVDVNCEGEYLFWEEGRKGGRDRDGVYICRGRRDCSCFLYGEMLKPDISVV